MFRRETRVLPRHHLEQGVAEGGDCTPRRCGPEDGHHWVETEQMDPELDAEPVGRRASVGMPPPRCQGRGLEGPGEWMIDGPVARVKNQRPPPALTAMSLRPYLE